MANLMSSGVLQAQIRGASVLRTGQRSRGDRICVAAHRLVNALLLKCFLLATLFATESVRI